MGGVRGHDDLNAILGRKHHLVVATGGLGQHEFLVRLLRKSEGSRERQKNRPSTSLRINLDGREHAVEVHTIQFRTRYQIVNRATRCAPRRVLVLRLRSLEQAELSTRW